MIRPPPISTLFPSTALFRSRANVTIVGGELAQVPAIIRGERDGFGFDLAATCIGLVGLDRIVDGSRVEPGDVLLRSEEHTSELQSRQYLVCRLLLEKKESDR